MRDPHQYCWRQGYPPHIFASWRAANPVHIPARRCRPVTPRWHLYCVVVLHATTLLLIASPRRARSKFLLTVTCLLFSQGYLMSKQGRERAVRAPSETTDRNMTTVVLVSLVSPSRSHLQLSKAEIPSKKWRAVVVGYFSTFIQHFVDCLQCFVNHKWL